jgi:3-phenylpropionate/cinnamic acid dioxygenase small subunit
VLRRDGDSFRIARRHLFLDQTVIRSANMSTLF